MKTETYATVALTVGLIQDCVDEYLNGDIPLSVEQVVDLRRGRDVLHAVLRAQEREDGSHGTS